LTIGKGNMIHGVDECQEETKPLTSMDIFAILAVSHLLRRHPLVKGVRQMKVIAYLLGFGHIALCTWLILYTRESIAALKAMFRTYQLKYLAAIPAAYALLFLISASMINHPWLFRIVGLLAAAEAVVAFTNPRKIYSEMLNWYFGNVSNQIHRLFGIIGIIFGTVILTWIP
jgi:hypothetical protein